MNFYKASNSDTDGVAHTWQYERAEMLAHFNSEGDDLEFLNIKAVIEQHFEDLAEEEWLND